MVSGARTEAVQAPGWFGSAAQTLASFPVLMAGYAVFYAVWWPFAWGIPGIIAFAILVIAAVFLVLRGLEQVRHAAQFPSTPTPEEQRQAKAMFLLNSITHPLWMLGSILLVSFGQGRWALPLMVFIIGAHFLPIAPILGRTIDYLLGPLALVAAVIAGVLARDDQTSWLVVFAVAGVGGAVSTLSYAIYLAWDYQRLCARAGVVFPPRG